MGRTDIEAGCDSLACRILAIKLATNLGRDREVSTIGNANAGDIDGESGTGIAATGKVSADGLNCDRTQVEAGHLGSAARTVADIDGGVVSTGRGVVSEGHCRNSVLGKGRAGETDGDNGTGSSLSLHGSRDFRGLRRGSRRQTLNIRQVQVERVGGSAVASAAGTT